MPSAVPIDLRLDVTAAIGSGERLEQAAWLFLPAPRTAPAAILCCLAGGTYDRHYWHLEVPGHEGYSFADHLAGLGFAVVALDHLGVGASSDPVASGAVGLEMLAAGDVEVARQVRARIGDVPMFGVGHSMGACVALVAQASTRVFDGLVLLGQSITSDPAATGDDLAEQIARNTELVCGLASAGAGVGVDATSLVMDRAGLRELFHASDVPEAVVAADDAVATRVPARAAAEVLSHDYLARFARQIDVPVLLAFGAELDLSPDISAEASAYPASSEVTVELVEGSRHCHNLSSHRALLWDAIGGRVRRWPPRSAR